MAKKAARVLVATLIFISIAAVSFVIMLILVANLLQSNDSILVAFVSLLSLFAVPAAAGGCAVRIWIKKNNRRASIEEDAVIAPQGETKFPTTADSLQRPTSCPQCGKELHPTATFCTGCGWRPDDWRKGMVQRDKQDKRTALIVALVLSAAFLLLTFVLVKLGI